MGRRKRNKGVVNKPAASAVAVVKKKMTPEENRHLPAKEKKEFQTVVVSYYIFLPFKCTVLNALRLVNETNIMSNQSHCGGTAGR